MDFTHQKEFTRLLLDWHRKENRREMPWKGIRDPYRIWLAEIILQQTRVEQGREYYERFVEAYPTLADLAAAREEEVFRLWQGLGYYNRCRNLLHTARELMKSHGGVFPKNYEELLSLKGIGPYTAAAIASFAFDLPHAVVDGNVLRVLARYFALHTPIDTPAGKKYFTRLANELIPPEEPAIFNQAIMDLGATICKPQAPNCGQCPLNSFCKAFHQRKQEQFPVKLTRKTIRERYFHYLVCWFGDKTIIRKREEKDIWCGLYEFPMIERERLAGKELLLEDPAWKNLLPDGCWELKGITERKQQLTHQLIHARFFYVETTREPRILSPQILVQGKQLHQYAFPGIIVRYLHCVQQPLLL
ncbi:A/G-specific DNA-adenine glycosylase [Thermoflavifilum thermophilum]|uniref:Adenine DNA glycosylase n=2 Tax=Thermoflavifilum thermophilum TaxID=1393122 RepID=A0A1I7NAY1_9BACT|nr:A/G-specific DNA-adenine glycosylase [Thermoflavifilum thermophilum]